MFRITLDQLCIEAGTSTPTEEMIMLAKKITENDMIHREYVKLPPRAEHPFPLDYNYDIECYPNAFTMSIKHYSTGQRWLFEISEWKNQGRELFQFLCVLNQCGARMVGFNNNHYDYPVIHLLCQHEGYITHVELHTRSKAIFADQSGWEYSVWDNEMFVKQVDLLKIHHFDNRAKSTSLKMLEFNMRSHDIKDLPYDPSKPLTREQLDNLIAYNDHDVDETEKFYIQSLPMLEFRDSLSQETGKNFTNHNDTKIGKDYFIMELAKYGIKAHKSIQSKRDFVNVGEVILDKIQFERPEFNQVLNFFKQSVVDKKDKNGNLELKGFFSNVNCVVDGFQYDFGAGGIHGSLHKTIVRESDTHALIDLDVASYYPNLAIVNKFFPEHLSVKFCDVFNALYDLRVETKRQMKAAKAAGDDALYVKLDAKQAMLKLALNGVYGSSNDRHSPFLDPKYCLSTTINGQLFLCMLAEQLHKIPNLKMVQINTDGLTFLCPREHVEHVNQLRQWWEQLTGLELEEALYKAMYIRDVNSYMAQTTSGKIKRIGAYAHETALENPATREIAWHKDHSALVVAKAAEAALIHGTNIEKFIRGHEDIYDFMLRTKVPRSMSLELWSPVMWGQDRLGTKRDKIQNITRYYVSNKGAELMKIMPPLAKTIALWQLGDHYRHEATGEYQVVEQGKKPKSGRFKFIANPNRTKIPNRENSVESGWLVKDCSTMSDFDGDINFDYYIEETRKLVDPLILGEVK